MSKYNFYRNFGDLSGDSVVTDIYRKRIRDKRKKRKNIKKCGYSQKIRKER